MNITTLFLDCIVLTLDMEVILNLPDGKHVAEYEWYLVTSDVYLKHSVNGGVCINADYGYEQYIIGKQKE
jgi:hypothetical protein